MAVMKKILEKFACNVQGFGTQDGRTAGGRTDEHDSSHRPMGYSYGSTRKVAFWCALVNGR